MTLSAVAIRAKAELELRRRGITPEMRASRVQRPRDPAERAAYASRPADYLREVLGLTLTPQQVEAVGLFESCDRLLLPSGNNLGKTYLLGALAVWFLDARGAMIDPETGREMGARVLLPGPDHDTIFDTVYSKMLIMAGRAESRGYAMPGNRSELSVTWAVGPEWGVLPFSPAKRVGQDVAHTASGRHHINQAAFVEEGQGVVEPLWRAVEGMCSGRGNKIVSSFNPTEASGPTYQRARQEYRVMHLSAFDHPNVLTRSIVVPGAVDPLVIDGRVRQCADRGPAADTIPDPQFGDFVYAAPPGPGDVEETWEELGPREDGILGHPLAEPHVWRPTPMFEAQVLGQWPRSSDLGLFDPGAWDAAVDRWKRGTDPLAIPDALGVDPAREGADTTCYAPRWGESGAELLRRFHGHQLDHNPKGIERLRSGGRARVGRIRTAPRGRGPEVADFIAKDFRTCPWIVDEASVGAAVCDHARDILGIDVSPVSFAGSPPERLADEQLVLNVRAALYVRAAMLLDRGLVDCPDDPLLREEILAHEIEWARRASEEEDGEGVTRKEMRNVVKIWDKDKVKKKIGRSPDRADAFVLALWEPVSSGGWYVV